MVARKGLVFMAAAVLGLAAQPAHAQGVQPGLSKTLLKCEDGTGKTLSKFVSSKSKCIDKCIATARKTSGPFGGCFAPESLTASETFQAALTTAPCAGNLSG